MLTDRHLLQSLEMNCPDQKEYLSAEKDEKRCDINSSLSPASSPARLQDLYRLLLNKMSGNTKLLVKVVNLKEVWQNIFSNFWFLSQRQLLCSGTKMFSKIQ